HGWAPEERAGPFFRALGLVYALGFAGYILCPAAGPYLDAGSGFTAPPAGWLGTRLAEAMVVWGSNRVDCFPSLHCAVSGLVLVFDARADRRLLFWHAPVVAGIWLSTVWLGQHYFVDVVGGLVLLAGVLWLVRRPASGALAN
ncbi:MAG: phosphatase PAP2 family protein, partial [Verrucomicrobiaceae bacterium]